MIPVATLVSLVFRVASGLIISAHEILWIPTTDCTWNAISSLLKFVIIIISVCVEPVMARFSSFARLITVIILSLGMKMPSMLGCEFGTGVTS